MGCPAAERILMISGFQTEMIRADVELGDAAVILRNGGTVAFPTETVYGLGASALDPNAVARIFDIKQRPRFDPLIVHVSSVAQGRRVVREWPDAARELSRHFWPGPLTLVLPKADAIPDIVTSGLPTVALRMPAHPLALALIAKADVPVAAPSANRFGSISPTTSEHVRMQLGEAVDRILDGGPCRVGIESTVVALAANGPLLLRAGGTPVEEIERVIGPVQRPGADPDRPTSPGQCARHYATRTPLVLYEDLRDRPVSPRSGLLTLRPPRTRGRFEAVEVLSPSGNLQEAAANLFAALYRLDALGLDRIVAVKVPDVGVGLAINDRLLRAAHEAPDAVGAFAR
jgi:L-threonylcarbamoyladenylate synthase